MEYKSVLEEIYTTVNALEDIGKVATYIPELAKIDIHKFGVYLQPINQNGCGVGNFNEKFSIQSVSKILLLLLVYKTIKSDLWKRMGFEPSGSSFNSLIQLEMENGIPRNPLINAGAIVLCDILIDLFPNPKEELIGFVRKLAINNTINYNNQIAKSESETGFTNYAIANLIKSYKNLNNKVDEVLDLYFHVCAIEMTCQELSKTCLVFANQGVIPETNERILSVSRTKRLNAVMQTCGFYDEAGQFAFKVGLPGKSGVGGGIIAIYPKKYSVAVWSPKLNKKGNSFKGMKLLELLTTETDSIF
jgi:glutaminase